MSHIQTYQTTTTTQQRASANCMGSFPHVENGVPIGWTAGRPTAYEGSESGVSWSFTQLVPAQVYAVCLAVE